MDKRQLRKIYREKRNRLPLSVQREAAQAFMLRFIETDFYKKHTVFSGYLAHNGELDLMPLIKQCWQDQKSIYMPVLHKQILLFARYLPDTKLKKNIYGIWEPDYIAEDLMLPESLNVVLAPLVAFTKNKDRLGMGGGYYDKAFSFLRKTSSECPKLIGVGYSFQEVKELPLSTWDVPLKGVMTETATFL